MSLCRAGVESEMRNALRFAREKGMEKLNVYKEAGGAALGMTVSFWFFFAATAGYPQNPHERHTLR